MNDHISKPVRESELDRIFRRYGTPVVNGDSRPNGTPRGNFKVIDLGYMKEISNGDALYEKLVTEQFLHLMPRELEALSAAVESATPVRSVALPTESRQPFRLWA